MKTIFIIATLASCALCVPLEPFGLARIGDLENAAKNLLPVQLSYADRWGQQNENNFKNRLQIGQNAGASAIAYTSDLAKAEIPALNMMKNVPVWQQVPEREFFEQQNKMREQAQQGIQLNRQQIWQQTGVREQVPKLNSVRQQVPVQVLQQEINELVREIPKLEQEASAVETYASALAKNSVDQVQPAVVREQEPVPFRPQIQQNVQQAQVRQQVQEIREERQNSMASADSYASAAASFQVPVRQVQPPVAREQIQVPIRPQIQQNWQEVQVRPQIQQNWQEVQVRPQIQEIRQERQNSMPSANSYASAAASVQAPVRQVQLPVVREQIQVPVHPQIQQNWQEVQVRPQIQEIRQERQNSMPSANSYASAGASVQAPVRQVQPPVVREQIQVPVRPQVQQNVQEVQVRPQIQEIRQERQNSMASTNSYASAGASVQAPVRQVQLPVVREQIQVPVRPQIQQNVQEIQVLPQIQEIRQERQNSMASTNSYASAGASVQAPVRQVQPPVVREQIQVPVHPQIHQNWQEVQVRPQIQQNWQEVQVRPQIQEIRQERQNSMPSANSYASAGASVQAPVRQVQPPVVREQIQVPVRPQIQQNWQEAQVRQQVQEIREERQNSMASVQAPVRQVQPPVVREQIQVPVRPQIQQNWQEAQVQEIRQERQNPIASVQAPVRQVQPPVVREQIQVPVRPQVQQNVQEVQVRPQIQEIRQERQNSMASTNSYASAGASVQAPVRQVQLPVVREQIQVPVRPQIQQNVQEVQVRPQIQEIRQERQNSMASTNSYASVGASVQAPVRQVQFPVVREQIQVPVRPQIQQNWQQAQVRQEVEERQNSMASTNSYASAGSSVQAPVRQVQPPVVREQIQVPARPQIQQNVQEVQVRPQIQEIRQERQNSMASVQAPVRQMQLPVVREQIQVPVRPQIQQNWQEVQVRPQIQEIRQERQNSMPSANSYASTGASVQAPVRQVQPPVVREQIQVPVRPQIQQNWQEVQVRPQIQEIRQERQNSMPSANSYASAGASVQAPVRQVQPPVVREQIQVPVRPQIQQNWQEVQVRPQIQEIRQERQNSMPSANSYASAGASVQAPVRQVQPHVVREQIQVPVRPQIQQNWQEVQVRPQIQEIRQERQNSMPSANSYASAGASVKAPVRQVQPPVVREQMQVPVRPQIQQNWQEAQVRQQVQEIREERQNSMASVQAPVRQVQLPVVREQIPVRPQIQQNWQQVSVRQQIPAQILQQEIYQLGREIPILEQEIRAVEAYAAEIPALLRQ